mgnify:CR=1 FL=1
MPVSMGLSALLTLGSTTNLYDGLPLGDTHEKLPTLLELLLNNKGRVLSRAQIEEKLYDWAHEVESNAVEVHIHHLRKKLASLGRQEWVQEEFSRLRATVGAHAHDPRERYQRIRGWENLKPQSAAVLRELAAWRDEAEAAAAQAKGAA